MRDDTKERLAKVKHVYKNEDPNKESSWITDISKIFEIGTISKEIISKIYYLQ